MTHFRRVACVGSRWRRGRGPSRVLPPPGGLWELLGEKAAPRALPRRHARRRALAHLPEDAGGQHAGHVRRRRGGAQVLPA